MTLSVNPYPAMGLEGEIRVGAPSIFNYHITITVIMNVIYKESSRLLCAVQRSKTIAERDVA